VNEFLQQFLVESRELIEQASSGLLALERSPQDAERLDGVFRAFHTLKGGAGIVEFPAMERAMHAAEDVLSDARSTQRPLTIEIVGHCLACLDEVLQWLDTLEETGELPSITAAHIDRIVSRFGVLGHEQHRAGPSSTSNAGENWVAAMLTRHANVRAEALTAIRFIADSDCFYRGEDPVGRMIGLPALLALDLEPLTAWPSLEEMDPFASNLMLTALTASPPGDVTECMRGHSGECAIVPVFPDGVAAGTTSLPNL